MFKLNSKAASWSCAFALATGFASAGVVMPAVAADEVLEEVIVTGSRIKAPGMTSASPIFSIGSEEISFQQDLEVEKILRSLPSTIPGDGSNVNNGTSGAATINLRGLGAQRNLVMIDGMRMVPYNFDGTVDTQLIPTALLEAVDIVTGGASAVYGSDAIAGAINFRMKQDFEGVDLRSFVSETGDNDGETENLSLTLGSSLADGRGNIAMNITWQERKGVQLGQRDLGQLGISTASGGNLDAFLRGEAPSSTENCSPGTGAVTEGGSTTSIPTRLQIIGVSSLGQFRDDRTVGENCSVFNFNPFNYYQTPQERYTGFVTANYEFAEEVDVYSRFTYSNVTVSQQIAPSGTFGQPFSVPVSNPFFSDQALNTILTAANASVAAGALTPGTVGTSSWLDQNGNNIVDAGDYLPMVLRRRTLELGPRSENFDTDHFQFVAGVRGDFMEDFNYDVAVQYGETNRTTVRGGYTNLTNIQNALDTDDGVTCNNGDATCVPIDLFGGFGTITPAMAAYASAIALQQQKYDQFLFTASVGGVISGLQVPTADNPVAFNLGYETREENGSLNPDECLKLAPASCQGGAGGNLLPIAGGYKVDEYFVEAVVPLLEGKKFADSLSLELGFRSSDYNLSGTNETWKAGLTWRPIDTLLVRVMQQSATRAPNVGELFSPVTTGLDNATFDPCSVGNPNAIDAALTALCVSTGMTAGQVGAVDDIISGQINLFQGSDPANLPAPEDAETFTAGFVFTPDVEGLDNLMVSMDYYDIKIDDYIGNFSVQEVLDQCYIDGNAGECAKINRVSGGLTISGSGINLFTTNLNYLQAEGVEMAYGFALSLGKYGQLSVSGSVNKYITQESLSSTASKVIDCNGFYGTSCDPISEWSANQRVTWTLDKWTVSAMNRYLSGIDILEDERASTFSAFQKIEGYSYLDLYASYDVMEGVNVNFGIDNALDKDPPIVGNEAGSTTFNSGNTFPSTYSVLGRIYTLGFSVTL